MDIVKLSNDTVKQIIDAFTQQLLDGRLKPGDRIPTEVELSEQFGVARNTVSGRSSRRSCGACWRSGGRWAPLCATASASR